MSASDSKLKRHMLKLRGADEDKILYRVYVSSDILTMWELALFLALPFVQLSFIYAIRIKVRAFLIK